MTQPSGDIPSPVTKPPIVCFSHLAWDAGLFQRPQQIMSRLAALGHEVYYFACIGHQLHRAIPHAGPVADSPGVNVFTVPYAPGVRKLAGPRKWLAAQQIARVLAKHKVHQPILWFYHPSLFALGYSHRDSAIVYDVMDHFPSFEDTVKDIYFDELMLLAEADVVFTGGRALQGHTEQMLTILAEDVEARARQKTSAPMKGNAGPARPICLPSGVDLEHFAKATAPDAQHHAATRDLPKPVFGYFGAVDERIDWEIIRALARQTAGSVLLAGPILRQPPQLPPNVHLVGPVPYAELPSLLAGFDVCLIPFRKTELVKYVSPTKTPEYLAGGKPVVSTPVPDVAADYNGVVAMANSPEGFARACERMATAPPDAAGLAAEAAARAHTWDQIATEMDATINATVHKMNAAVERPV